MTKIVKLFTKKIFMLCIILIIISVLFPSYSSAPFDNALKEVYEANYNLDVVVDEKAANQPFLPVDMVIEIPVTLKLEFTGRYEEVMDKFYTSTALLELSVNNTPGWATATVTPKDTSIETSKEPVDKNISVFIKVDEDANPSRKGIVQLKILVKKLGAINELVLDKDIPFTVGYFPMLDINPDKNVEKISPMEKTTFTIDIKNLGNAKTKVNCKIIDVPKDWTANITENLILGTRALNEENKDKLFLTVKPPYGFGYHNEREIIKVRVTPIYYGNDSIVGDEYILSFVVQNKGFSTPGFEISSLFFVIFIVSLILCKKFRRKDESKHSNRGEKK